MIDGYYFHGNNMNLSIRKPICPTFIHDDFTRISVLIISITICLYILFKIMRYYGRP
jgi:hypothetical protein